MTIGRFDIELLEAFVAVAETGNVTRAGERLNRTQPCVSSQLRRLEDRAGKRLLDRFPKLMSLTASGQILYEHAVQILKSHEEARMRLSAPELTGRVRIGLPEWYAPDGCNPFSAISCGFTQT